MELSLPYFQERSGRDFQAQPIQGGPQATLRLSEVIAHRKLATKKKVRLEPFSLVFHGTPGVDLGRGTVRLSPSSEPGSHLDLYMEPMGWDADRMEYEIVVA